MSEDAFFETWKIGVILLGSWFFGPETPNTATYLDDLQPDVDRIAQASGTMSPSELSFASCFVSFYDAEAGAKLAKAIGGDVSMYNLVAGLDRQRREIVAELIVHANFGWHA